MNEILLHINVQEIDSDIFNVISDSTWGRSNFYSNRELVYPSFLDIISKSEARDTMDVYDYLGQCISKVASYICLFLVAFSVILWHINAKFV